MGQRRDPREIKAILEPNKNENIMYQNPQDVANPILRGKFIVTNTNFKKKERSQTNKLTFTSQGNKKRRSK